MFLYELHRSGVTIEHMKNKQGKVYGLKFTYDGHSFKASEIGREFGYRILPKQFEIGIAPQDEPRMTFKALNRLALLFAKQMGLDDHQWVAVTHKDTDNLHIHIIANRISLCGQVYDTTFVGNRAARVVEKLSREYGLAIANEVRSA